MTDIAYEAGIKAILEDFTGALTLDGEVYAVIVSDEYTPDSTDESMDDIDEYLWDGTTEYGNSIADAAQLEVGTSTSPVDITTVSNKVYMACDDIEFGECTDAGSATGTHNTAGYVVLFVQESGTDAVTMSYPLACLAIATVPVLSNDFTFVVDTDGVVLWDPQ